MRHHIRLPELIPVRQRLACQQHGPASAWQSAACFSPGRKVKREDSDGYSSSDSDRPVQTRKRSAPLGRGGPPPKRSASASAQRARAATPEQRDSPASDASGEDQSNLG